MKIIYWAHLFMFILSAYVRSDKHSLTFRHYSGMSAPYPKPHPSSLPLESEPACPCLITKVRFSWAETARVMCTNLSLSPPTPSTVMLLRRCWTVCSSIGESPDGHCCSNIAPTWLQLVSHAFCFSLFLGSWLNCQTRSLASNIAIHATSSIGT